MNEKLRYLIQKQQSGTISLNEQIELSKLLSDPKNQAAEDYLHSDWISHLESVQATSHDLKPVLHRVHHRIRLIENSKTLVRSFWQTFQRAAAILIIPLLMSFSVYYYFQQKSETPKGAYAQIECPPGARIKFNLPDGSTGYLNSGSSLKYQVGFPNGRKVDLAGEAYFEVVHNPGQPFHVNTKNLDVVVLGTVFDVVANTDETVEEVTLQSGKVNISSLSGKELAILAPNEQLTLNIAKRTFTKEQVEADQYTSWKDGKLVFRNENMREVARRLSRWYNADVIVDDKSLDNYAFHATFTDEPLDEVLKLLSLTTPLSYTEQQRKSNAEGVFQKRKIILKTDRSKIYDFK